jgi:hypothetical protein
MRPYRVFISYAREDRDLVQHIADTISAKGLVPMWDKDFHFGLGFPEQIKAFIAHAHVFLPVITEASSRRGWVHQEIGYAMALNIPVLPVAFGSLPGEMIQHLQALQLSSDLTELTARLSPQAFENLLSGYRKPSLALSVCAELAEDRAAMMAEYARSIIDLGASGYVRQKGGLSSYHIPDRVITHPVWKQRYGQVVHSEHHCRLQREERLALEKHARASGCRLIIDPTLPYEQYGRQARIVRLETLLEFLESMPDDKVQVAFNTRMHREESITLVGDWFAAQSVSVSITRGYRQTVFTTHAPSMESRIELFDQEFDELLQDSRWTPSSSRLAAISSIKEVVAGLKEDANDPDK